MRKDRPLLSHLQNAAIALLTLSAVFLLTQTPLFGDFAGKTPYELAQDWLSSDPTLTETVTVDASDLALPVRVVFTNEYARFGLDAVTTADAGFEQAGALFREALGSAGEAARPRPKASCCTSGGCCSPPPKAAPFSTLRTARAAFSPSPLRGTPTR